MNILPKKNWHVRTKANIERVRRDEAKAAEEAKEVDRRIRLAEQEARTSLLRDKAKARMIQSSGGEELGITDESTELDDRDKCDKQVAVSEPHHGHVNLFAALEAGHETADGKGNKEAEAEKKKEQEEYEKKVGYLTYLGQDTEELTGEQVWWKKLPTNRKGVQEAEENKAAVGVKQKDFLDPLGDLKKYLKCDGVRLTLQKYERKKEETENKAINFESSKKLKNKRKRKRSSSSDNNSRSRSRSRERRKHKKKQKSNSRKKHKKVKKRHRRQSTSSESSEDEPKKNAKINLEKMRRQRLDRERVEREKANRLVFGEPEKMESKEEQMKSRAPKYSSQFNPEIARQNKLDPKKKYWLE